MAESDYVRLPLALVDKINTALNIALSLALVHAREVHPEIMAAATGLDDAMNAEDSEANP